MKFSSSNIRYPLGIILVLIWLKTEYIKFTDPTFCFSIEVLLIPCLQTNTPGKFTKNSISEKAEKSTTAAGHMLTTILGTGWIHDFQRLRPQFWTYPHHFSGYQLPNYMLSLCQPCGSTLETTRSFIPSIKMAFGRFITIFCLLHETCHIGRLHF